MPDLEEPPAEASSHSVRPRAAAPDEDRYVIALKRELADTVDPEWIDLLSTLHGVSLRGHSGRRAQVDATPEGAAAIMKRFGEVAHVEKAVEHNLSAEA